MEIEYRGANCVVINDNKTTIVVDPTSNVSVKEKDNSESVILTTMAELSNLQTKAFLIDMPGEYEHNDISVKGIPTHRHTDESGEKSTMYRIEIDGIRIAIIGHTDAPINDDDLENLGIVDVVVIPVGGGGYTLDARDAASIVRQISPKIVVPTHYDDGRTKYDVPQDKIDGFIKEVGSSLEKAAVLKIKSQASIPEHLTVYELALTA